MRGTGILLDMDGPLCGRVLKTFEEAEEVFMRKPAQPYGDARGIVMGVLGSLKRKDKNPKKLGDYMEIPAGNVIKESRTKIPGFCDKPYIVYIYPGESRMKIHINTDFSPQGKKVRLCTHYDRGLCETLEEYKSLPIDRIENQAYGSWMDGAR